MSIRVKGLVGDSIVVDSSYPLPFLTYDENRCITGLVQDESVNVKSIVNCGDWNSDTQELTFPESQDEIQWTLEDENKTFTDKYATGIGADVFSNGIFFNYPTPLHNGHDGSPVSVSLPNATTIGDNSFAWCQGLTSISLPSATTIGDNSFAWCYGLTSISLPSATTIGDNAFTGCASLASISIPNATSIGDSAFLSCTSLTSISLPNTTSIESYAFTGCASLASISIPNATSIGQYAFYGCSSDLVIDLSQNPNFSVANEESYRSAWGVSEGITIIFIDSPIA